MKKSYTPLFTSLLLSTLLLPSCATLISGSKQTVRIVGQPAGSKVYVNDKVVKTTPVGNGSSDVKIKLKRTELSEVKVSLDGYKDHVEPLYQAKTNPWAWVGAAGLLGSLVSGVGLSIDSDGTTEKTTLSPGTYGLLVSSTAILVDYYTGAYAKLNKDEIQVHMVPKPIVTAGSQSVRCTVMNVHFKKGDKLGSVSVNGTEKDDIHFGETLDVDSDHLKETLNASLKELGYTVPGGDGKGVFAAAADSRYVIQGEMKDIKYNIDTRINNTARMETSCTVAVTWKLLNRNRQLILEQKSSGEARKFEEGGSAAFEDAFENAFYNFLLDKKVDAILAKSAGSDQDDQLAPIVLRRAVLPSAATNNLGQAARNVVTIITEDGHGSGCVITTNGYIITNAHVIGNTDEVKIIMADGTEAKGKVARVNGALDLALVKIDAEGLSAFQLPTSNLAELGADVFAIGTPADKELGQTVTKGIVSGRRKVEGHTILQTDVSINPGNSGGALVVRSGQLVGIVNAKLVGRGIEGIGFAIPAEQIMEALQLQFVD